MNRLRGIIASLAICLAFLIGQIPYNSWKDMPEALKIKLLILLGKASGLPEACKMEKATDLRGKHLKITVREDKNSGLVDVYGECVPWGDDVIL